MINKLAASCAVLATAALGFTAGASAQTDDLEVMLLHGIPGFDADVAVDGTVVIEAFEPGDMADLQAFGGQTLENLEVRAAGTEALAIGPVPEFAVPASGAWTVVAHLDGDGQPTITPFQNMQDPTPAGHARLTVRHVAAAPSADVLAGDDTVIESIGNGESQDLTLPTGTVDGLQLILDDDTLDIPAVELDDGENVIVYAVGSLEEDTLDFFVQRRDVGVDEDAEPSTSVTDVDTTPEPTRVDTGSPLGSDRTLLLIALVTVATLAAGSIALTASRRSAIR